jgi:hypothetical protein
MSIFMVLLMEANWKYLLLHLAIEDKSEAVGICFSKVNFLRDLKMITYS